MERNRAVFYDSVLDAPLDDWIKRTKTIFDSYHGIGYRKEELGEHYLTLALERADETKRLRSDLDLNP